MCCKNLLLEDLIRPCDLVQFLLDQAKLNYFEFGPDWGQSLLHLPNDGIKENLSDCCTFLDNMYYTQDLRLLKSLHYSGDYNV